MTVCRSCSGEAVTITEGKVKPRGCGECVAQSLIKDKNNKFGIMPLSHAVKLCSCLASGHKDGFIEQQEPSKEFVQTQIMAQEYRVKEDKAQQELVFDFDKKKQEEQEYYQKRKQELEELDSQQETPYMGEEKIE